MLFTPQIGRLFEQADARALATTGPEGVNVVPISMCRVTDTELWVFDFFMRKTIANIKAEPEVAVTAWSGFTGVQIKATATYHTDAKSLKAAQDWVNAQNQDRVVRGLITLTPTAIFDVSPGGVFDETDLISS